MLFPFGIIYDFPQRNICISFRYIISLLIIKLFFTNIIHY